MPNVMDRNDFRLVIDAVDDAVVTDTDTEEVLSACQLDRLGWVGLGGQRFDLAKDPLDNR
jgi:hypothetical protein